MNNEKAQIMKDIHMARYQASAEFDIQEHLIRTDFLRRDFTKRQMKIMTFIFNYSYGLAKEWALIPKMKDFEVAGISSIKIRKEIDQLIELGVLEWKQEENLFRIIDPREWTVAYNSSFSFDRAQTLFDINLQHGGIVTK